MITCTRRIQFCAGHRVYGHESKCANAHGHNYVALFEAAGEPVSRLTYEGGVTNNSLDKLGRIIDFSVLKERIGGWIDANWDHGFIHYSGDVEMYNALALIPGQKLYSMRDNPTAENMARFLLNDICPRLLEGTGVKITRVTIYETENCKATATL